MSLNHNNETEVIIPSFEIDNNLCKTLDDDKEAIISKHEEYKTLNKIISGADYISLESIYSSIVSPSGGGFSWCQFCLKPFLIERGVFLEEKPFNFWREEEALFSKQIQEKNKG